MLHLSKRSTCSNHPKGPTRISPCGHRSVGAPAAPSSTTSSTTSCPEELGTPSQGGAGWRSAIRPSSRSNTAQTCRPRLVRSGLSPAPSSAPRRPSHGQHAVVARANTVEPLGTSVVQTFARSIGVKPSLPQASGITFSHGTCLSYNSP